MQKQDILAAQGLKRIAGDLEALTVESICVKTRPAEVAVGVSHIGGWPDLPEGAKWPEWKGKPLGFVAQFNLAEVHPFDHQNRLPAEGMLYFFYDAAGETYGERLEERGGWKVLYDRGHHYQRAQVSLPESAIYHSCAVEFSNEITLPLQPQVLGRGQDWNESERAEYETLTTSQRGIQNRLLGHADAIQDDMHLQAHLLANGKTLDTPPTDENQRLARNWVLLFQVDSDPNTGMRWANNGRLYYWIEQQNLEARRFDRVWMILQSE